MLGNEFDYAYFEQRHAELLRAAERERLIRCLEETKRLTQRRMPLSKRVLAATGNRLVSVGSRLQQVAAH